MPNCVRHLLKNLAQVSRDGFSQTTRHGDVRHFFARYLFRLPARQRPAFSRKGQPPSTTSPLWRHTRNQQDAGVCLRSCCCSASLRTLRSKIGMSPHHFEQAMSGRRVSLSTRIKCFFLSLSLSICFSSNFLMYNWNSRRYGVPVFRQHVHVKQPRPNSYTARNELPRCLPIACVRGALELNPQ